jgi:hypothetical protein
MGLCNSFPWRVSSYSSSNHKGLWPESPPGVKAMLTLPTGTYNLF